MGTLKCLEKKMKEQNVNILFCFKDNTPQERGGGGESVSIASIVIAIYFLFPNALSFQ